ncbi:MAG: RNB domain-containing ribonuclease, partial [Halieaceae bacterium]|nr:RNB domain-containing ribonuclease [Halieaceae bacterium]
ADPERVDLCHLNFVSIDAARTQDIDDALYAEVTSEGWVLYVAVADPTAYLDGMEGLDEALTSRATSTYFHGDVLPMLPEAIGRDFCALSEGEIRPSLVCKINVSDAGKVGSYEFILAKIQSKAKLSYAAVDRYVTGHNDQLIAWSNPLEALVQAYRALRSHRENHELVMEDRTEYRWQLNDERQIGSIETAEKLASQHLVEECMIAANRSAAHFLAMADATGPFVVHPGFRKDRASEAQEFLKRYLPELTDIPTHTVAGYQQIFSALNAPHTLPLRGMVNRLLTRAVFSTAPAEHMGMALNAYTNFTSPLRKYVDFLTHRQIKRVLANNPGDTVTDLQLQNTAAAIARGRGATQAAERWLTGNYLDRCKSAGDTHYTGEVAHVTSAGFTVRLSELGLEGQVDLRKDPEKFSFDKWTASLTSSTRKLQLGQTVEVDYQSTPDAGSGTAPQFELAPGCALKPAKE